MLTFTTSNPGVFCDTSDRNDEFINKMEGERKFIGFKEGDTPIRDVYIHGSLETILGFDIPLWLSGEIKKVRKQDCQVYSVDGKTCHLAVLHLFEGYIGDFQWQLKGFITFPHEVVTQSADKAYVREIPEEECYEG